MNCSSRRESALTILAGRMSGLTSVATSAWINFDIREFPQMGVHNTGGPLADKESPISLDDERNKLPRASLLPVAQIWQFLDAIVPASHTEFFQRTNPALRIAWRANQRSEFHE